MGLTIVQPNNVVLQNTVGRLKVSITDTSGAAADPTELQFSLFDLGGTAEITDTWPAPAARIQQSATGEFYIDIGDQAENTETDGLYRWVADWRAMMVAGGEYEHQLQNVNIISIRTASFLPELRLLIDKSRKRTTTVDGRDCFLGYNDAMLLSFLEGGLNTINAYQPSLIITLDYFPLEFKQILLDSALITGVMSQQLYALDTDIPTYSDNGVSFTISHQPGLASFLNQVTQRLDKLIPMAKLQLINSGTVHTQMGPNFRLQQLLSAAQSGATFRNIYFRA